MKLMAIDKLRNKHAHFLMGSEAGSMGESGKVDKPGQKRIAWEARDPGATSITGLLTGHVELPSKHLGFHP